VIDAAKDVSPTRVAGGYTGLDMGLTSLVALNGSEDIRTQSAIAPMESTPKTNPRSEDSTSALLTCHPPRRRVRSQRDSRTRPSPRVDRSADA
jgi:hypothetical protein